MTAYRLDIVKEEKPLCNLQRDASRRERQKVRVFLLHCSLEVELEQGNSGSWRAHLGALSLVQYWFCPQQK